MIRLIRPDISFSDIENDFKSIFESGIFTKGIFVKQFTQSLCDYTGALFSNLTTSATTALSMCLKLLDIKPGDEIILSDFSFPATVNVVEDLYAYPVFIDVDSDTYNMRPDDLEKKITKKTKAVIFVDAFGNPSGLHDIKSICQKYELPLIEDAACALGSCENGIKCGNIADLTCFSFHPRKLLTTGEGGAILTNNNEYKKLLDIKLEHGAIPRDGIFDFVDIGYNYRLPELQASMGLRQLQKLDEVIKIRKEIKDTYINKLSNIGFVQQRINNNVKHNVQSIVFKVPINTKRNDIIKYLKEKNIETTIGTYCLSNCTYYKNKYNNIQPVSKILYDTTITLPCYPGIDIDIITDEINKFIKD